MSNNEMIVRLIEALAWPVFSLTIILILRKQILELIKSLGRMKWKDVEFEFGRGLDMAERDAKQSHLPPADEVKTPPLAMPPQSLYEQMMNLTSLYPRAAVTESWRAIELATADVAKAHGIPQKGQIAGIKVIQELVDEGKLEPATVGLYEKLRKLRAESAHALDFQLSSDEAVRFVDLALSLANRLQKLAAYKHD